MLQALLLLEIMSESNTVLQKFTQDISLVLDFYFMCGPILLIYLFANKCISQRTSFLFSSIIVRILFLIYS